MEYRFANTETVKTARNIIFRLIVAAFGVYFVSISFMKWPDILVDYGRELYAPWQVSEGQTLYQDIAWFNGPVSVYTHALLFSIFGVHIHTLVIFNLLLTACFTCVLYAFFKRICDELTAFACTLTFVGVFAFGHYTYTGNYNFVCPYSYELTHAIFFSVCALYCFHVFVTTHRNSISAASGFLTGLTFLAKPEVFLALTAALITGLVFSLRGRGVKRTGNAAACLLAGFFVPSAAMAWLVSRSVHLGDAVTFLLSPYKAILNPSVTSNIFYTAMQGRDNLSANTITMIKTALFYVAMVGFLMVLTHVSGGLSRPYRRYAVQAGVAALAILCIPMLAKQGIWNRSLRGLPLIGIVLCIMLLIGQIRERKAGSGSISAGRFALLPFGVFSVVLAAKIFFNVNVTLYGFALAMPLTLFVIAVLFTHIPSGTVKKPEYRPVYRFFAFLGIGMFVWVHLVKTVRVYDLKNDRLAWNTETLWDFSLPGFRRGRFVNEALKQIELLIPANATCVVFPEGIMLNYLSRRINPTPYINFMPIELMVFNEETILASLKATPPDFVILVDKRTTEYGYDYFGTDYGVRIHDWVHDRYAPAWSIGGRPLCGEGFGIQILRRK